MKFKKIILFFSALFDPLVSDGVLIDNRYRTICHLGSGGYGHSYLVMDQHTGCRLVLKTLRLHRRLFRSGRQSFETEKELLMSITHHGFPRFEQSGTFHKIPYYTMEFIEGKNFEQLILMKEKDTVN